MTPEERTVSELGEAGVVELVTSYLPRGPEGELWSGDDAALVAGALVTTDTMVEGEDFDLAYCDGFDLGWKAVAVNASDVAAMAGTPSYAVATLALPPSTPVDLVDGIGRGLAAAAERWGVAVVGGDLSAAPLIVLGITLVGRPGERVVTRSGAKARDRICITGAIGGSWGGLTLLRAGRGDESPGLVERHLRPQARVEEGQVLADLGATAMIDVSDGFAVDLTRLMRASGTGCSVDPDAVPLDPRLDVLGEADLLKGAILGGEDFELLATLPPEAEPPAGVTVVGEVTEGPSLRFGEDDLEELGRSRGWDHLRGR
ncbi:MAG: thiamine-phosphate kinase [Actinomycetota bacterium]|nr:thiamine-phosphate kinase [Actinomycetota bacterium]